MMARIQFQVTNDSGWGASRRPSELAFETDTTQTSWIIKIDSFDRFRTSYPVGAGSEVGKQ